MTIVKRHKRKTKKGKTRVRKHKRKTKRRKTKKRFFRPVEELYQLEEKEQTGDELLDPSVFYERIGSKRKENVESAGIIEKLREKLPDSPKPLDIKVKIQDYKEDIKDRNIEILDMERRLKRLE